MHPDNVLERRGAALAADLRLLDAPDLLALDLPPRAPVIGPLVRGSVTLLRSKPGLGKSWLALSLAYAAAAGGSACGWAAPRPARVLYVDAQMTLALLQARLAAIAGFGGMAPRDPLLRPSTPGPRPEPVEGRGPGAQDEGRAERTGRESAGGKANGRRKKARHDEVIVDGPQLRRYVVINPPDPPAPPAAASSAAAPVPPPPRVPATLRLLAAEAQALPMPDLGAESGRAAFMRLLFEPAADGSDSKPLFDLVVLDGLSALLRSARGRNDPAREFAEFLSALRRAGLAVLLVDRARPRRRISPPYEDLLDAVIAVKRPPGLDDERGGVHMALILTGRAFEGAEEGELRLVLAPPTGETPGWRRVARLDAAVLAAWRLEQRGLTYRAIARELGVSPPTAWRLARRAGALDPAVLEAAAREMDGDLLPTVEAEETAATVVTGETPEPPRDSADWVDWKVRRIERAVLAEATGLTPARAARLCGELIKATRAPPGVFFQGERWKALDRAVLERLQTALDAPLQPPSDPFDDVPSLRGLFRGGSSGTPPRP